MELFALVEPVKPYRQTTAKVKNTTARNDRSDKSVDTDLIVFEVEENKLTLDVKMNSLLCKNDLLKRTSIHPVALVLVTNLYYPAKTARMSTKLSKFRIPADFSPHSQLQKRAAFWPP